MNPWRPKVGDMVQIWDGLEFNGKEDTAKISEHGHYGVIVDISEKYSKYYFLLHPRGNLIHIITLMLSTFINIY